MWSDQSRKSYGAGADEIDRADFLSDKMNRRTSVPR